MKPTEVWDYGRTVYEHIKQNPMTTRGELNTYYRTSSDDKRNRNLTWVLEALLAHNYIFKLSDREHAQVSFWTREYRQAPAQMDDPIELNYTPVDVFGPRPTNPVETPKTEAAPPADESLSDPVGAPPAAPPLQPPVATETVQQEPVRHLISKEMSVHYSKLKEPMKSIYVVLKSEPTAIFNKRDQVLLSVFNGDQAECARQLGRMFSLGVIRRLKDPVDNRVAYYTLFGLCPVSLTEDRTELSRPAMRRRQALLTAMAHPDVYRDQATESDADAEDEDQQDDGTGETEPGTPLAFLSSNGGIVMTRTSGVTDEFDLEESMALVELFLMTSHDGLRDRLNKMKVAQ